MRNDDDKPAEQGGDRDSEDVTSDPLLRAIARIPRRPLGPPPGTVIAGRYCLDHPIGEGGMGVVWSATHTITRKAVALKLVKGAGDTPEHRSRLVREARASAAVQHANVCEVHDFIELEDGSPVIVMELLVGESLAERLQRDRKLPLGEFAGIFLPVVSAVGAAHALGIVHRDLKPDNIFLTRARPGHAATVKVLDFGIAKLTATEGSAAATGSLTTTGAMVGTPSYMSPEQAFGEKDIDTRADVWALGVILYRCLSGILPTEADNLGQVFKNIVMRPIRPLEQIEPELPREVTDLCARMLSRLREERPTDLHEVVAVLAPYTEVRAPEFGPPMTSPAADAPARALAEGLAAAQVAAVDPLARTDRVSKNPTPPATPTLGGAATEPTAPRAPRRAALLAVAGLVASGGLYLALHGGTVAVGAASSGGSSPVPPPAVADATPAASSNAVAADVTTSTPNASAPPPASASAPVVSAGRRAPVPQRQASGVVTPEAARPAPSAAPPTAAPSTAASAAPQKGLVVETPF